MFLKSTKFFFLASLGLLVFLTIFLLWPSSTLAIKLGIPIAGKTEVSDLGEYLATFYRYFIGIIGILATVMIMFGGFRWITAAGSPERIKEGKGNIMSAIIAVVLMLCSYLILNLINPALVQLQLTTGVTPITDIKKDMCVDKTPCNTLDAKNNCIGKWCPDKGGLPQTCILKDEKSKTYECGNAKDTKETKKACESFNPSGDEKKCDAYSDLTIGKVCRAANLAAESCQFKDLLQCDTGWYRVNCREGGDKCWNSEEGPKFCASTARLCVDKDDIKNPAKGIDGICCRKQGPEPNYQCKWN